MALSALDPIARQLFDAAVPDFLALLSFILQFRLAGRGERDLVSDVVARFAAECDAPISQKNKNGVITLGRQWARVRDVSLAVKTSSIVSLAGVIGGAFGRPGGISFAAIATWLALLLVVVLGEDKKATVGDCRWTVWRLAMYYAVFTAITLGLKLWPILSPGAPAKG